jgi:hypothetical protein
LCRVDFCIPWFGEAAVACVRRWMRVTQHHLQAASAAE